MSEYTYSDHIIFTLLNSLLLLAPLFLYRSKPQKFKIAKSFTIAFVLASLIILLSPIRFYGQTSNFVLYSISILCILGAFFYKKKLLIFKTIYLVLLAGYIFYQLIFAPRIIQSYRNDYKIYRIYETPDFVLTNKKDTIEYKSYFILEVKSRK